MFTRIIQKINAYAENETIPYVLFGYFGLITYPLFYFFWVISNPGGYENFPLRLFATLICIPLIFHEKWPEKLKYFLPSYWYITLWYCLPFLFTFLLLKNNFSEPWTLNTISIVTLCVLLINLGALLLILPTGIAAGYLAYYWVEGHVPQIPANFSTVCVTYFTVIFLGALFNYRKETIKLKKQFSQKLHTMEMLGASIAHELRTPLRSIASGINGIEKYLPSLIQSYETAKKNALAIPTIPPPHYRSLIPICETITSEVQSAFTFINMLLIKANLSNANNIELTDCVISGCIEESLARYPFTKGEKDLIEWKSENAFHFKGDYDLMVHVIFNLLKNALYYIKAAGKGKIIIWTKCGKTCNTLHFKDTGLGMPPDVLNRIFEKFYTNTPHGTGIGLAFCKFVMEAFNGKIECFSEQGSYTEFVLSFPPVT